MVTWSWATRYSITDEAECKSSRVHQAEGTVLVAFAGAKGLDWASHFSSVPGCSDLTDPAGQQRGLGQLAAFVIGNLDPDTTQTASKSVSGSALSYLEMMYMVTI
jgi:hypothetical protein